MGYYNRLSNHNYRRYYLPLFTSVVVLLMCGWLGIALACTPKESENQHMIIGKDTYKRGRLQARPRKTLAEGSVATGVLPLKLDGKRDGYLYVPAGYTKNRPAALALLLHGAGGQAQHGLSLLRQYADNHNIILLAPDSRATTWDIIARDAFGVDVAFIDQALEIVFKQYAIDPSRMGIGGFSDGASYALSIGLTNGDLFTHILAFSPGFVYTIENTGKPAVFISHGTKDRVLPIDPCSRRIVAQLKQKELKVHYTEFDGEHQVPAGISESAVNWFIHKK